MSYARIHSRQATSPSPRGPAVAPPSVQQPVSTPRSMRSTDESTSREALARRPSAALPDGAAPVDPRTSVGAVLESVTASVAATHSTVVELTEQLSSTRSRLSELQSQLITQQGQNSELQAALTSLEGRNADLTHELALAGHAKDAASSRLAALRESSSALHGEVASLEAEAQRLRAEAAAAEAETEKAAARAREEELQLVAQLRQAETEALRREGDARAAIDRKREQLAELQTVAGALRERLSQREVLQAQATELRAKLAASKGLALHKQLQAVLAENKVASARLQAQLAAAQHARTAASAELDGFTRERDALQRDLAVAIASKQHAAASLLSAKRELAFLTVEAEAQRARGARAAIGVGGPGADDFSAPGGDGASQGLLLRGGGSADRDAEGDAADRTGAHSTLAELAPAPEGFHRPSDLSHAGVFSGADASSAGRASDLSLGAVLARQGQYLQNDGARLRAQLQEQEHAAGEPDASALLLRATEMPHSPPLASPGPRPDADIAAEMDATRRMLESLGLAVPH